MARQEWDETWMGVADVMSKRSLCSRDQVGAVIVDRENRVLSTGYNGPPAGYQTNDEPCINWCTRSINAALGNYQLHPGYLDCPTVHAERNAIVWASGRDLAGSTLYSTSLTCFDCAKEIAAVRIARVFMRVQSKHGHRAPISTKKLFADCGVEVFVYHG